MGRPQCRTIRWSPIWNLLFIALFLLPTSASSFEDPIEKGHRIYQKMLQTILSSQTLSYEVTWTSETHLLDMDPERIRYHVWLKKPHFVRIEVKDLSFFKEAVLIGDGKTFWSYWPTGYPRPYDLPDQIDERDLDKVYFSLPMKRSEEQGHWGSVSHRFNTLGIVSGLPILNPSHFFGSDLGFERQLKAVIWKKEEIVQEILCDVIEVSYPNRNRTLLYWVSTKNHFPLKAQEHFSDFAEIHEDWSNVKSNRPISNDLFSWTPPEGWKDLNEAKKEKSSAKSGLLDVGRKAPEFQIELLDGQAFSLSDHLGSVVWLSFWGVHCPPCKKEMEMLQRFFEENEGRGFLPLGFNVWDDLSTVQEFVSKHNIEFPVVAERSAYADHVFLNLYQEGKGESSIPLNYIIDKVGIIRKVWRGGIDPDQEQELLNFVASLLDA